MKIIHYINSTCFTITLLLYITIFYGLMAQVFLGSIQVIIAIILFIYWNKLTSKPQKHLIIYTLISLLYGLLWLTDIVDTDFGIVFIAVIPMMIAGYFVYITYLIKKLNTKAVI